MGLTEKQIDDKLAKLKAELMKEIQPKDFEVGKWYKFIFNHNFIVLYKKEGLNFGFIKDQWCNNIPCTNFKDWKLVDMKEVEKLLVNEAKKRYKVGDFVDNFELRTLNVFDFRDGKLFVMDDKSGFWITLFGNGEWVHGFSPIPLKNHTIKVQFVEGAFITPISKEKTTEEWLEQANKYFLNDAPEMMPRPDAYIEFFEKNKLEIIQKK